MAGMSTEAFEDYFFQGLHARLLQDEARDESSEIIDGKHGPRPYQRTGTDLRSALKAFPAIACGGQHNIPDGEVFSCPVRDSVEGSRSIQCPDDLPRDLISIRPSGVQKEAKS